MFFRREQQQEYTFSQRLSELREAGFRIQEAGERRVVVLRDGFAAVVFADGETSVRMERTGLVTGGRITELASLGYQTFWEAPDGTEKPATAERLHAFHTFLEDLRAHLGRPSYYNEALGTTHAEHHYDRLAGRP